MTLDNTPATEPVSSPAEGDDIWNVVNDLGNTSETPQGEEPTTEQPVTQEAPQENPTPEPQSDDEVARLRRVIAMNPQLRQAYEADKFGIPIESPPQQQQPPMPQVPQAPAATEPFDPNKLFGGEEYDPYNPQHAIALQNHLLQQQLAPFAEFIQSQQQENEQLAALQEQQQFTNLERGIDDMMDKEIGGYRGWLSTDTPESRFVIDEAGRKFSEVMQQLYPPNQRAANGQVYNQVWYLPKAQEEVIKKIAPDVKKLAGRFGLNGKSTQSQQVDPVLAADMRTVSSNAVPAQTVNAFDIAHKKGDVAAMFAALG